MAIDNENGSTNAARKTWSRPELFRLDAADAEMMNQVGNDVQGEDMTAS